MKTNPRRISRKKLFSLFDASVHHNIENLLTMSGVDGVAVFENLELYVGAPHNRQALAYGPDCTYARLADLKDGHLGDVPSRMAYCTMYYRKHMRSPIWFVTATEHSAKFPGEMAIRVNRGTSEQHYRYTVKRYDRICTPGRSGLFKDVDGSTGIRYSFENYP